MVAPSSDCGTKIVPGHVNNNGALDVSSLNAPSIVGMSASPAAIGTPRRVSEELS